MSESVNNNQEQTIYKSITSVTNSNSYLHINGSSNQIKTDNVGYTFSSSKNNQNHSISGPIDSSLLK